jgi:hypothetical protein
VVQETARSLTNHFGWAMIPRVSGVAFVVFAALAVHAAGGLEDILRVQAAERAGLEDLIHRMLGDHHLPPKRNGTVSVAHRPVLRPASGL